MATIKSYTDLSQSKKLAEILQLESSDMCIGNYVGESGKVDGTNIHYYPKGESFGAPEIIYAWSLAALLGVLTKNKICHYDDRYYCQYMSEGDEFPIYSTAEYDNPVDACVAMIEKLNELKLL